MEPSERAEWLDSLGRWLADQLAVRWPHAQLVKNHVIWEEKGHRFTIRRAGITYLIDIGYHVVEAHRIPSVVAALERDFWLEHLERRGCIYVDRFKDRPVVLHCL